MSYSLHGNLIPDPVLHLNITLDVDPIVPQPHCGVRPEGAGVCPEGVRPEGPSSTFGREAPGSLSSVVCSVGTLGTDDRTQVLHLPQSSVRPQPPLSCSASS